MSTASQTLVLLFFVVVFLVLIIKPGQGRPAQPLPTATIYSASDTAGGYCVPPDQTLRTYDPSPVEMMCLAGPVQVFNRSVNGVRSGELLDGGVVAASVTGTGVAGITVPKFDEWLKSDSSQIIVFGAWLVDILFHPEMSADAVMANVQQAVQTIRSHGKTPVIRGAHQFVVSAFLDEAALARCEQFHIRLHQYCRDEDIEFLDMRVVPFKGVSSLAPDLLHASAEYHQSQAVFIAGRLQQIAGV